MTEIATLTDEQVFALARAELSKARTKFPWWPSDMVHAAAVASEESGEVVKSVNNYFWNHGNDTLTDIRKEAIQAIAMWVRFLTETPDMDAETRENNQLAQIIPTLLAQVADAKPSADWEAELMAIGDDDDAAIGQAESR